MYKKSNLHYTRAITPKRVTSSGAHLRDSASGQHSSEETSQRWRAIGDTAHDLTRFRMELRPSASIVMSSAVKLIDRFSALK